MQDTPTNIGRNATYTKHSNCCKKHVHVPGYSTSWKHLWPIHQVTRTGIKIKKFFFKSVVEVLQFHIAEPLTHKMQQ